MLIGSLVLLVWLLDDGLSFLYLQFCGEDRAGGRVQGEVRELVTFYLRGREASTIGAYGSDCKDAGPRAASLRLS